MHTHAFGLLQVSNIASGVGNGIVMIAVPWLVLNRTGSPAAAGLLGALVSLPGIFVSPLVGVLIDRVGRRTISLLKYAVLMISVYSISEWLLLSRFFLEGTSR